MGSTQHLNRCASAACVARTPDTGTIARTLLVGSSALLLLISFSGAVAAQTDTVRICGAVIALSGRPVSGAQITMSSRSALLSNMVADSSGRFCVPTPLGADTVILSARSGALQSAELHIPNDQFRSAVVITLSQAPKELHAVTVVAARRKPPLLDFAMPDPIGSAQLTNAGSISPGLQSDLTASATSTVGAVVVPGGQDDQFSVLGLSGDQNVMTLNGLQLPATELPRGAALLKRVSSSIYDVSHGNFSGAQLAVQTLPGGEERAKSVTLLVEHPSLSLNPVTAQGRSATGTLFQANGVASGPLQTERAFYSAAGQITSRQLVSGANRVDSPFQSVLAPSVADSVLTVLRRLRIPVTAFEANNIRKGVGLIRLDLLTRAEQSMSAQGYVRISRGNFDAPDAAFVGSRRASVFDGMGGVQLELSQYLPHAVLARTRLATNYGRLTINSNAGQNLPMGIVTLMDSSGRANELRFGNANMDMRSTQSVGEIGEELSWNTMDSKHLAKVTAGLLSRAYTHTETGAALMVVYPSLDALGRNTPSSFITRSSGDPHSARVTRISASVGDLWSTTPRLQVEYGIRFDEDLGSSQQIIRPAISPPLNVPQAGLPSVIYLSPRVGIAYALGDNPQRIGAFGLHPAALLRIGTGLFRGEVARGLLEQTSGFAPTVRYCASVAPADSMLWTGLQDGPSECAVPLGPAESDATYFSRDFRAPASWRTTIGLTQQSVRGVTVSLEGIYSLGYNETGSIARNTVLSPAFRLQKEGGRPVYAPVTAISPQDGTSDPASARIVAQVGPLTELQSDLLAHSAQISLALTPTGGVAVINRTWAIRYAYNRSTTQSRGFDDGDLNRPERRIWVRSPYEVRHQWYGAMTFPLGRSVTVNAYSRVNSGFPFAPYVSGDINGNGSARDRAFVLDPAATTDSMNRAAMEHLMSYGMPWVRACLREQRGRIAPPSSCNGPWTAFAGASVGISGQRIGLPARSTLTILASNLVTLVDLAIHGRNHTAGWAGSGFVDPVLYTVIGFDPVQREYRYGVNPLFGSSLASYRTAAAPLRIAVQLSIPLGRSRMEQKLETILAPAQTAVSRLDEASILIRYKRAFPNPVAVLLASRDSLHLVAEQITQLSSLDTTYLARLDSIWNPVAARLATAALADSPEMLPLVARATHDSWQALIVLAGRARSVLSTEQFRSLDPYIAGWLLPAELRLMEGATRN